MADSQSGGHANGISAVGRSAFLPLSISTALLTDQSADDFLQDADEVRYLGTSLIRDEIFHHIGIRSQDVDVQIWIASEGRPLPGKLVISSKWEGGSPRFVGFFQWDAAPTFSRDLFKFEPPDDAVEIEFLVDLQQ